jgi:adenosylcobinamide kinase / adenosylcobinamide-phosphate guanylyltransferase
LTKRKSGDRPDTSLGLFNFDGRVEELYYDTHCGFRGSCLRITSRFAPERVALPNASERRMPPASGRDVTLILGGVRSGKSRYALQLAARAQRVTFLATAERREDEEMQRKIERHRAERPQHWTTIEEPLNLGATIRSVNNCDLLLVDCLTLFAGKLLDVSGDDSEAMAANLNGLCAALEASSCPIVLVSNEVGSGIVPAFEMGRRYRELLGEINQRVAAIADHVVLMVAGLPLSLKGSLNREVGA